VMHWMKQDLPGLGFEFSKLQDDLREALPAPVQDHFEANLTSVGFSILFEIDFNFFHP